EGDLHRLLLQPGPGEEILEPDALPSGVAHGPDAPLDTGDVRIRQPAPVPRALKNCRDLHRLEVTLERGQVEGEGLLRRLASDLQLPLRGRDLGNARQVVADEEGVVGGEDLLEDLERGLEVRGPVGPLDEWPLAGERLEEGGLEGAGRQARRADRRHIRAPGQRGKKGPGAEQRCSTGEVLQELTPGPHVHLPAKGMRCRAPRAFRRGSSVSRTRTLRLRRRTRPGRGVTRRERQRAARSTGPMEGTSKTMATTPARTPTRASSRPTAQRRPSRRAAPATRETSTQATAVTSAA